MNFRDARRRADQGIRITKLEANNVQTEELAKLVMEIDCFHHCFHSAFLVRVTLSLHEFVKNQSFVLGWSKAQYS